MGIRWAGGVGGVGSWVGVQHEGSSWCCGVVVAHFLMDLCGVSNEMWCVRCGVM